MLLLDKLGNLRPFDEGSEEVAETASVRAARCSCQSKPARVGILFEYLSPRLSPNVMRFVNDDEVSSGQRKLVGPHAASPQRLNAGYLNAVSEVSD